MIWLVSVIPGAVFFDITYKAEHTEYLRRNLSKPGIYRIVLRSSVVQQIKLVGLQ